jgi:hypothetical protein
MGLSTYFPLMPCSAIPRKDQFEAAGLGGSNAPRFTVARDPSTEVAIVTVGRP